MQKKPLYGALILFVIAFLWIFASGNQFQPANPISHVYCESPKTNAILPETDTESIVNATPPLFDAVIIFSPNATRFDRNFNLTRNLLYQISYQAYIPFTYLNTSLNVTDPYGNAYRLIQTQENLTINYTMKYYRFLCNENGTHRFELDVQTNISLSFYLCFQELENMTQFIRTNTLIPSKVLIVDEHSEAFLINTAKKTQTFFFPLIPDLEYRMVYFRGVGIPNSIAEEINYTNPIVKIEMWYGGHYFLLAPNFTSLNAFEVGGQFDAIRFAVWKYDVAQIKISTNAIPLNLNYGFSIFSIKELGDGPIADPYDFTNTTTIPENNTESDVLPNTTIPENKSVELDLLDKISLSVNNFLQVYADKIIITSIVTIGALIAIPYIKRLKTPKSIVMEDIRE